MMPSPGAKNETFRSVLTPGRELRSAEMIAMVPASSTSVATAPPCSLPATFTTRGPTTSRRRALPSWTETSSSPSSPASHPDCLKIAANRRTR